jgi:hypothetical protein
MKHLDAKVLKTYRQMVEKAYPDEIDNWPIINGYNLRFGKYRGWDILVFEHTGNPIPLKIPLEHLTAAIVGVDDIGSDIEAARKKLTRYFHLSNKDMLIILNIRSSNLEQELNIAFKRHESLLKRQTAAVPRSEIPKPHLAPEAREQIKADEPVKVQDKPAAEPAAAINLPQKENEQALEAQEQKTTAAKQEDSKSEKQPYKNKVLIIHGSNEKMKKSSRNFLLSLGIQAVEWAEALLITEKPDPDSKDVISSIFEHCQAAVILLTNDKQDMSFTGEGAELRFLPQSELNTLFIAGLASGVNRHRTVVVGLGNPEPFRNIHGLYITGLDNTIEKRKEFIERLKVAGCEIKTKGKAWQISGDFDIKLKPVFAEKLLPSQALDIKTAEEKQSPQIQPDITPRETASKLDEDKPSENQPAKDLKISEPDTSEQPSRGRSFMDSLSKLNILKTKKQPTISQPSEKAATIPEELNIPEPVDKKPPKLKQEPVSTSQQPERESMPKKDRTPIPLPETTSEFKDSQKPLKEPAPKKAAGELSTDESDFLNRIKALEEKLEALKNRGGRINQRAVVDLEKQIQSEKYRLRTIRQLANIENLKKSYENYNKKENKEDK